MAKKFLTDIDLNGNQLEKAVVHALATAPATGVTGQIYFNTTDNCLYQYYSSAWHVVGNVYTMTAGAVSSNTVPITLLENGTTTSTINIAGAGGATITSSNGTITITTADNNTTYSFSGESTALDGYQITVTPSSGSDQTITIPYAISNQYGGAMTRNESDKLGQIEAGAQVNVQSDWGQSDNTADDYIKNKPVSNGRIFYGTCSTAAGTAAKTVTCSDYNGLQIGDIVVVNFLSGSNVNNPTLNVNSTGAKYIKYRGVRYDSNDNVSSTLSVMSAGIWIFYYDGTYWWVITNIMYENGSTNDLDSGSDTNRKVWSAKVLHDYIASQIGDAASAMVFKGTLGTGGTITDLPTTGVKVGDTYMVITAGTYASQVCEVGDLIIAATTTPTWTVAQTNINGAVTATTTTTNGYLAKFTGDKVVANGPKIGSDTTKYLRNDGVWAVPPGTCYEGEWDMVTILAGNTYAQVSSDNYTVYTWKAYMGFEEVVVDFKEDNVNDKYRWEINTAQSSPIYIHYYRE